MRIIDITQLLTRHGLINYYCLNPCLCHVCDNIYVLTYRTIYYNVPAPTHPWGRWWSDSRLFEKYHPKYGSTIGTEPVAKIQRKINIKNTQPSLGAARPLDLPSENFSQQNKLFQINKVRKTLGPDYMIPLAEPTQSQIDFNILDYDSTSFAIIQIDESKNVTVLKATNNLFQYEMNQDCRIHREDDHFVLTYNGFINNNICMLQRLLYISEKMDSVYLTCESYCNEEFTNGIEKNWTMFKDNCYIYSMCDGIKLIIRNNIYNRDSIENKKFMESGDDIVIKQQQFTDNNLEPKKQVSMLHTFERDNKLNQETNQEMNLTPNREPNPEPNQEPEDIMPELSLTDTTDTTTATTATTSINSIQIVVPKEKEVVVDATAIPMEINMEPQPHDVIEISSDGACAPSQSDKDDSLTAFYPSPEIVEIVKYYDGKENIFFSLGTPCIPYKDGFLTAGHIKLNHQKRVNGSNFDIFFKRYFEGQNSKNLHKHGKFVYFMFVARFNAEGKLTHISNGFIPSQGSQHLPYYLVFPMGITFTGSTFYISYGEGDVRSKLVAFTEREFNYLLIPIEDIKPFNYEFKMLGSVPRKRILVLGYYGAHNTGDDAFAYIFEALNKPECSYTVKNPYKINYIPNYVDKVIVGGGDVLNPYFMERIKELFKTRRNIPAVAFSVGIPYPAVIDREFLSIFKKVVLRNPLDVPFVRKFHDNVIYLPDLVYVLPKFIRSIPQFTIDKSYINVGIYLTRTIYRRGYETEYFLLLQKLATLFTNILKHYNFAASGGGGGAIDGAAAAIGDGIATGGGAVGSANKIAAASPVFGPSHNYRNVNPHIINRLLDRTTEPHISGLAKICSSTHSNTGVNTTKTNTNRSWYASAGAGGGGKTQDIRAETKHIRLYFIPMGVAQHNSRENDIVIQRHIANIMKPSNEVIFLDQLMDIEEMVDKNNYAYIPTFNHIVSQMDYAICMRFHAHICSILHRVPITSMATTRKCDQLMKENGLENNILEMKLAKDFNPIDFDVDYFTSSIIEHIDNRNAAKSKMEDIWRKKQPEIAQLEEFIGGAPDNVLASPALRGKSGGFGGGGLYSNYALGSLLADRELLDTLY